MNLFGAKEQSAAKDFPVERREKRIPMAVGVQLSGHLSLPGVETTFTENVSSGGARVVTVRRWRAGDRVRLAAISGQFSSVARVAYCHPLAADGFAIGLEFLEPSGQWVIGPVAERRSIQGA